MTVGFILVPRYAERRLLLLASLIDLSNVILIPFDRYTALCRLPRSLHVHVALLHSASFPDIHAPIVLLQFPPVGRSVPNRGRADMGVRGHVTMAIARLVTRKWCDRVGVARACW